jgi:aminoglycoside phosphotransferase (APT) family kinase protein
MMPAMPEAREADDHAALLGVLERLDLLRPGERPRFTRLAGGVSSDIWRVDLERGPVCVKRALRKLKVEQDWFAPLERNAYEAAWMRHAGAVVPGAVPRLLGQDRAAGALVMAFLDPARHPLWKTELLAARVDLEAAAAVADRLGRIHAASAGDPELARGFATDRIFYDIRLEPYLLATGRVWPELADALQTLVEVTAGTRRCLVHGDVSPKNILLGPDGPVFLDAECAWFGDPAFDLAFCLNHLLLKCLPRPEAARRLLAAFDVMRATYLERVDWEARDGLEGRAARLLPGLFLARVDGKSPVEYLTEERPKNRVRRVGRALLADPPARLEEVRDAWAEELRT